MGLVTFHPCFEDKMELFVVLLAIGLSSSEKLHRSYLPPPGAKHAGGSYEDLQTPLEHPYENPVSYSRDIYQNGEAEPQNAINNGLFKSGSFNEDFPSTETTSSNTHTTMYPGSNYDTVATEAPEINDTEKQYEIDTVIENHETDSMFKLKDISVPQRTESFGNGYLNSKLNIPSIASSLDSYQPNAFGMYGGTPMIIKSNQKSQNTGNYIVETKRFDNTQNDLNQSDDIGRDLQNDISISSPNPNFNPAITNKLNNSTMKTENPLKYQNKIKQIKTNMHQSESDRTATVLNNKNVITPEEYAYSFDTSNGIHMDETATTMDGINASGSYSYTGDDGKIYSVIYTADENGFQPKGDHLPTPPPIPEAIRKVIEQAKIDKEAGIFHDGFYDEEKYGHKKYQGPMEYLEKIKVSSKLRNRNRGNEVRKTNRKNIPTVPKETDKHRVNRIHDIPKNINVFNPVYNLDGQFGMKKEVPIKYTQKHFDTGSITISEDPQHSFKQELFEPSVKIQENNNIENKKDQSPYLINKPIETLNHYQKVEPVTHINNPKDPGYYYVPPRQIFVEGRFQDIPTLKPTNEFSSIKDLKANSIPNSEFYYVDQRNINQRINQYRTKYITSTSTTKPENSQTYIRNFDHNINHGEIESNFSEISNSKSTDEIVTYATTELYNILSTDAYGQENTRNYNEENVFSEQESNKDREQILDVINLSTISIPSETEYLNDFSGSDKYSKAVGTTDTIKLYDDEGYYVTKPEIQYFFEDIPSSTSPIYTGKEIKSFTLSNDRVHGFGRPIQDNQQFDRTQFTYTETPLVKIDDESKTSVIYNFEEPLNNVASKKEDKDIESNLSKDLKRTKIKEIGEDFRGPKQQQRFDPKLGYFY